jgi:Protein of unknown function (DUF1153)
MLYGFGYAVILPCAIEWSTRLYPDNRRPVSLANSSFQVGSIIALQLSGVLWPIIGPVGVLITLGSTIAIAFVVVTGQAVNRWELAPWPTFVKLALQNGPDELVGTATEEIVDPMEVQRRNEAQRVADAPPRAGRWTAKRKASVVQAVRADPECRGELLAEHGISEEEFRAWEKLYDRHGVAGLCVSKQQYYRRQRGTLPWRTRTSLLS